MESIHCFNTPCQQARTVILTANEKQFRFAEYVAWKRKQGHDGRRKAGEETGSAASNWNADLLGALAETLLHDGLNAAGVVHSGFYFLTRKPSCSPDFSVRSQVYDVKATRADSNFFYVKEEQREEFAVKFPSVRYVFMRQIDERSFEVFAPVPADVVGRARLLTPATHSRVHAPCRSVPLDELAPLSSLRVFLPMAATK